jgi:hypothetical protein
MMDYDRNEVEVRLLQLLEELRQRLAVWVQALRSEPCPSVQSCYAVRQGRLPS